LISSDNVGANGFRKFGADAFFFFGLHSWQNAPGLHFQLLAKLDGILVRQNGTSAERDARPELVQCIYCNGSQILSTVSHLFGRFGIRREGRR
jgi:hypothetical protein